MITPSEFIRKWNGDTVRFSPASVETLRIPADSKRFLIEAGLPSIERLSLSFYEEGQPLPTLPKFLREEHPLPSEFDRYRVIGDDSTGYICLDESDEGKIVSVKVVRNIFLRGVNSNIPLFAESLLFYNSLPSEQEAEGMPLERWRTQVRELKQNINRIDPWTSEDEDMWWAVIVEQFLG